MLSKIVEWFKKPTPVKHKLQYQKIIEGDRRMAVVNGLKVVYNNDMSYTNGLARYAFVMLSMFTDGPVRIYYRSAHNGRVEYVQTATKRKRSRKEILEYLSLNYG